MESRTPDDSMRPAGAGGAEVHSRVSTPAGVETRDPGPGSPGEESTTDRAKSKAQDVAGQTKARAEQAEQQASGAAHRAKHKAKQTFGRAQGKLEESGAFRVVRDHALPALGIAFGFGFLLAGSGNLGSRSNAIRKAKQQLKGAVIGGLSATIAQEARSLLGANGGGDAGNQGNTS